MTHEPGADDGAALPVGGRLPDHLDLLAEPLRTPAARESPHARPRASADEPAVEPSDHLGTGGSVPPPHDPPGDDGLPLATWTPAAEPRESEAPDHTVAEAAAQDDETATGAGPGESAALVGTVPASDRVDDAGNGLPGAHAAGAVDRAAPGSAPAATPPAADPSVGPPAPRPHGSDEPGQALLAGGPATPAAAPRTATESVHHAGGSHTVTRPGAWTPPPHVVLDAPPARHRRQPWAVIVLAMLFALTLALATYLLVLTRAHQDRAAEWEHVARTTGTELAQERAELDGAIAELEAVRTQLQTAQARITELADEKAQIGDEREAQRQLVDYQARVSDAAGKVAGALDTCVDGQYQLISYLENAAAYDAADLARFRTDVQQVCGAARDANAALQLELER